MLGAAVEEKLVWILPPGEKQLRCGRAGCPHGRAGCPSVPSATLSIHPAAAAQQSQSRVQLHKVALGHGSRRAECLRRGEMLCPSSRRCQAGTVPGSSFVSFVNSTAGGGCPCFVSTQNVWPHINARSSFADVPLWDRAGGGA